MTNWNGAGVRETPAVKKGNDIIGQVIGSMLDGMFYRSQKCVTNLAILSSPSRSSS